MIKHLSALLTALLLATLPPAAMALNFNGTYTEDFNSMGASGTTPPSGWSLLNGAFGGNSTWTTSVPATGANSVSTTFSATAGLTAVTTPSGTKNDGFNTAAASGTPSNRMIATSPTGGVGSAIQLSLTNNTGSPVYAVQVNYLIQRFAAVSTANELPGYWLFYSLDNGTTWTNVSALNPVISGSNGVVVPNSVGVTTVPATTVALAAKWQPGATLLFRWVDDNAVATSPDQIIGLDNVTISVANSFPGSFSGAFAENFDSMGASGTLPPPAWSMKMGDAGTHTTWATSIPGTGTTSVATMVSTSGNLTVSNAPTATNNNGYNAAKPGNTADRMLATSPTGITGDAIQLQLTNTTGAPITALEVGYNIQRFNSASADNELPGYWLFYSVDNGATWTNASALNPAIDGNATVPVPNSAGITTVSPTRITLSPSWQDGTALLLRWVDDNAVQSSPDQVVGLDDVTITDFEPIGEAPTVAILTPAGGTSFTAPGTVALTASAEDSDGTVTKVEYFRGGTKIGEATSAPYAATWNNVTAGSYTLNAAATDNDGNISFSAPVSIVVNPAPGSGALTRGPYLQQASPVEMTVRWRSSQSIAGRVRFGTAADNLDRTADETAATTEHVVRLTGLTAATTYFYSVGSPFDVLSTGADHTFTTPPVAGTVQNTRIWVLGDAGTKNSSQQAVRDAFYTYTGSRTPSLVLELGDNAYDSGTDSEFQAAVFDMYSTMLRKSPFWSCLGNHETGQATAFVDTYPYFALYTFPTNGECGGVPSGTEHYYSFDYANIHFISLDSQTANRSVTGAMATWLQNDLESATAKWIIAFFHHPPYTKGSHDSDSESQLIEMRQNFLPILEAGGVDLVLGGHSHCYERSYLLDGHYGNSGTLTSAMKVDAGNGRPSGSGAYLKPLTGPRDHFGAVYSVAGSAGQTSGGSLNHPAHFISLNQLGSLVLDINGDRLDATFLRSTGAVADTFTVIKQGAADSDGDGLPDEWEISHGLSRFDPSDAAKDTDGDGLSNLQEFQAGTDPMKSDAPRVQSIVAGTNGTPTLQINTVSGKQYRVEANDNFPSGAWNIVADNVAGTGQAVSIPDAAASSSMRRIYRVTVLP